MCRAIACGSLPPELTRLWDRLSDQGVQVDKYYRHGFGEQQVPDTRLQLRMSHDLIESMKSGKPATAVLLTGDGAGFMEGEGFHVTLSNMHEFGWDIEVLSWEGCCNIRMKRWVVEQGLFISLDEHYNSVTFLEAGDGEPPRPSLPVNLKARGTKQPRFLGDSSKVSGAQPTLPMNEGCDAENEEDWGAAIERESLMSHGN